MKIENGLAPTEELADTDDTGAYEYPPGEDHSHLEGGHSHEYWSETHKANAAAYSDQQKLKSMKNKLTKVNSLHKKAQATWDLERKALLAERNALQRKLDEALLTVGMRDASIKHLMTQITRRQAPAIANTAAPAAFTKKKPLPKPKPKPAPAAMKPAPAAGKKRKAPAASSEGADAPSPK
jgi:hypothetical protein